MSTGNSSNAALVQLAQLQNALLDGRIDNATYERLKNDLLLVSNAKTESGNDTLHLKDTKPSEEVEPILLEDDGNAIAGIPEKVPWPGPWAVEKCGLYVNGIIKDRSGYDAINAWGLTATEEEKEARRKEAEALGWFSGMAFGFTVFPPVLRWLFGSNDQRR